MSLLGFSNVVLLLSTISACTMSEDDADAYGNFEAIETTVSAQADGELLAFEVREGDLLFVHQIVGQIDTVQLTLSKAALRAQREVFSAQVASVNAEVEILLEQQRVAHVEKQRIDRLFAKEAATQKQVDDIDGRISVIDRQIGSTHSRAASLRSQMQVIDAQAAQIDDRLGKATITNPVAGTVLTTFAEPHELVRTGSPLYRIANLSSLDLRAYLGETQLSDVAIGDVVSVHFDGPSGKLVATKGTVTWISSSAEFTPRTVQTRDERTNLVYAFKVRVNNPDGTLKIGMPADVKFSPAASASPSSSESKLKSNSESKSESSP